MEDAGLSKKGCHLLGALTRKQCPEIFRPGGSKASSPSSHTLLIFEDLLIPRKGPPTFVFWTHSQSDIYLSYLSAQNASTQSRVNVLPCISRVPECHKWWHAQCYECSGWGSRPGFMAQLYLLPVRQPWASSIASPSLSFPISWGNNSATHGVILRIKLGNICKATLPSDWYIVSVQ